MSHGKRPPRKRPSKPVPAEVCFRRGEVYQMCVQRSCLANLRRGALLGTGSTSNVYSARLPGDPAEYALKLVPLNTPIPSSVGPYDEEEEANRPIVSRANFAREIERTRLAGDRGIAPPLHGYWYCRGSMRKGSHGRKSPARYGVLLMPRVPGITLTDFVDEFGWTLALASELLAMFRRLQAANLTSKDANPNNVMVSFRPPRIPGDEPEILRTDFVDFDGIVPVGRHRSTPERFVAFLKQMVAHAP